MGTRRSLSPFPMHRTYPERRSRSEMLRLSNSETRRPVEYKTSSMALSRKPTEVAVLGASMRRSTSSFRMYVGRLYRILGDSRFSVGSRRTSSSINAYLKKQRSETRYRETDLLSSFSLYRLDRKSTTSSRFTVSSLFFLRAVRNSSNLLKSRP